MSVLLEGVNHTFRSRQNSSHLAKRTFLGLVQVSISSYKAQMFRRLFSLSFAVL